MTNHALFLRKETMQWDAVRSCAQGEWEALKREWEVLKKEEPELLVIGYPGMQTAALLLREKRSELQSIFPTWLLEQVSLETQNDDIRPVSKERIAGILAAFFEQSDTLPKFSPVLYEAEDHGIFGALWDLGEALFCGIEARLLDIPMKQAVIEILGHYQLNPYELPSRGVFLLVCKNAGMLQKAFWEQGLPAGMIGRITQKADRVLFANEEIRYLNIPKKSDLKDLKKLLKMKNSDNDFSL